MSKQMKWTGALLVAGTLGLVGCTGDAYLVDDGPVGYDAPYYTTEVWAGPGYYWDAGHRRYFYHDRDWHGYREWREHEWREHHDGDHHVDRDRGTWEGRRPAVDRDGGHRDGGHLESHGGGRGDGGHSVGGGRGGHAEGGGGHDGDGHR